MNAPEPTRKSDAQRYGGTLRDYVQILKRRKWIVLQALILVPVAAVAFSISQPARYQAQAQVLLTYQSFAGLLTNTQLQNVTQQAPDRTATTQAELARVPAVLRQTLAAVPRSGMTIPQLRHDSSVDSTLNSDLLTFSVTVGSPALATRLATAYANAYTTYRHELDTASLQRARGDVNARIAKLRASGTPESKKLASKLVETDQQLQTLETLQTNNATVVKAASEATRASPGPIRDGAIGVVLGLIIGFGLALLVDAFDTRVRSAEEVAARLGIPLLGRLPEPPRKLRERNALVMLEEPYGWQGEAFRMLRTNVDLANIKRSARVIAVASAVPGEGRSTTVANLAVAMARGGHRVAVVDLDLREPMLARLFRAQRDQRGITDVALGLISLDAAVMHFDVQALLNEPNGASGGHRPRLDLFVAGHTPPNPGEFVSSPALATIFSELRTRYDVVLVDTPPMLGVGDALALSAFLDAFLLVSNLTLARRGELHELRRALTFAGCDVLGIVVTASQAAGTYTDGGSYYGYGEASPAIARQRTIPAKAER